MRHALLIASLLLLAACGPDDISNASADPAANRIAVDLHGTWRLWIAGVCDDGSGRLDVTTTLAWVDQQDAGVNGNGNWGCGTEGGNFSITVGTLGGIALTLYRNGLSVPTSWRASGVYTPRTMTGGVDQTGSITCNPCVNWTAQHQ
jgi:hypothetical protein